MKTQRQEQRQETTTIELSYRIDIDRHREGFFNECARAKNIKETPPPLFFLNPHFFENSPFLKILRFETNSTFRIRNYDTRLAFQ